MLWHQRRSRFGAVEYACASGRAVIRRYEAVPPPQRVTYFQRIGNQHERGYERDPSGLGQKVTRTVRYRKKQPCYLVEIDGRRIAQRIWTLAEAKELAEDRLTNPSTRGAR